MTSRSILDVCDVGSVPQCSSIEPERGYHQHLGSITDTNEKTILDHTNYFNSTKVHCSVETGFNGQNFPFSDKIVKNQPCEQQNSSYIRSDLPVDIVISGDKSSQMCKHISSDYDGQKGVNHKQNCEPVSNYDTNSKQICEPVRANDTDSKQDCELVGSENEYIKGIPGVESGHNFPQSDLHGIEVPMETDPVTVSLCVSDKLHNSSKILTSDKNLYKHVDNHDNVADERSKSDVYDLDLSAGDDTTHKLSLSTLRKDQAEKENKPFVKPIDNNHGNLTEDSSHSDLNGQTIKTNYDNPESVSSTKMEENLLKLKQNVKKEDKSKFKVAYIYNKELIQICDQMQKIPNRASMVHSLIDSYGMTRYMRIVEPRRATDQEVKMFHDPDYLEFLKKISNHDDTEIFESDATQYGLTYDCPVHQGLYDYATMTAGATIVAAECLLQESCQVAINWCGGWHHAARDQASGFCYINDIVLGILKLREKYSKILYVDLDLHHGDGVEDAFSATSKVMTVSFHKYAPGFFPGTGKLGDVGIGKGQYYTINVPLLDGIRDAEFTPLVCRVLKKVKETFEPEAVVCQCGADGLAGDPMESFNLTHKGIGKCVYFLLKWNIPTLILGGGGYNFSNTARCWAFLTALAAGKQIPVEIPDHQYFMEYGPDYELDIQAGNRKNDNTTEYLRQVYTTVMNNISKIT